VPLGASPVSLQSDQICSLTSDRARDVNFEEMIMTCIPTLAKLRLIRTAALPTLPCVCCSRIILETHDASPTGRQVDALEYDRKSGS
jgi:hypothetical protein